jgi:acetylglutamate kinase
MKQELSIVKLGGTAIDNKEALNNFLVAFAAMPGYKILVHGGGKIASSIGDRMGLEAQYVNGRRITDASTLVVVTMVYAGLLNKNIVAHLQKVNCNAIGLSGADGNSIQTTKRISAETDFGFVGDVKDDSVNVHLINTLLSAGLTPVFNAITHDGNGQLLNTNADTIAAALAKSLSETFTVKLIYAFDQPGVMTNLRDPFSVIKTLNEKTFLQLKSESIIHSGMLPKLESCFDSLKKGVDEVVICHTSVFANINSPASQYTTLVLN